MTNFKNIALLLCGILGGVAIVTLFRGGCGDNKTITPVSPKQVDNLVQKTNTKEKEIQVQIDSIAKASAVLSAEIKSLSSVLQKAKEKNQELAAAVIRAAKEKPVYNDSLSMLADCDSLKTKALQLIVSNAEKDSLYDLVIEKQEKQIVKKDSAIQLHQQQYISLRNFFDESITQQRQLLDQNKLFQKQLKRQRVKNKLLSGITLIAAGITTHYLIKR